MMRAVGLAAALMLAAQGAAAEPVEFAGGGLFTNFTGSGCADEGFSNSLKLYLNAWYAPPLLGDNGPQTRFTTSDGTVNISSYVLESGAFDLDVLKNVTGEGVGAGAFTFVNQPKMMVTEQTPARIKEGTQTAIIIGEIRSFEDVPNCRAKFRVTLTRRP